MRKQIKSFKNEQGKKYNYLTVLAEDVPVITSQGNKSRRWIFKCDCGNTKSISPSNVFSGSTKSCGCKKKEITNKAINKYYDNKYKYPVERRLYSSYKKHGKDFNLSLEKFIEIVNQPCNYCGTEPIKTRFNKTKSKSKKLNGVDRINSSVGYTEKNVVSCCTICNVAKNTMSVKQFLEWVNKIHSFQNK